MNESIILSQHEDTASLNLTTAHGPPNAIPLSKDDALNLIEQFVGDRKVFFRPRCCEPEPTDCDMLEASLRVFDNAFWQIINREAGNCKGCGRLNHGHGFCPECTDKIALISRS
jgi:hypothetical protein